MPSVRPFLASVLLLSTLAACGAEPATQEPPAAPSEPAAEPAPDLPPADDVEPADGPPHACADLTRKGCMESTVCTLVLIEPEQTQSYACRPSSGDCEEDLAQARLPDEPALCTDREGCAYRQPQCYCHCRGYGQTTVADGPETEGCDCECAGGLPPACITAPE